MKPKPLIPYRKKKLDIIIVYMMKNLKVINKH